MKTFVLAEESRAQTVGRRLPPRTRLVRESAFASRLAEERHQSLWIADSSEMFERIFHSLNEDFYRHQSVIRRHATLFLFADVSSAFHAALDALFRTAIVLSRNSALGLEELLDVVTGKNAQNYVIGGEVDLPANTLALIRGDMDRIVVPLSIFKPSGDGIEPDFSKFGVEDSGQTLKFGEYEASVDSVLYEFDPAYRKDRRASLLKKDKSFGSCLRRLRLQKNLKQSDFAEIDAREIGRIERGEVTPRTTTIEKIAKQLEVQPAAIKTF